MGAEPMLPAAAARIFGATARIGGAVADGEAAGQKTSLLRCDVTAAVRAGVAEWTEANKREDRAPHKYALEDFGLVREGVEQRFAAYRAAFLEGK